MGRFFSDEVEKALEYIYYDMRSGRGAEGMKLLEAASSAGDGDASCLLGRCLCGPQYVWSGHHFPEDSRRASKLLHQAVQQGSALGVLVAKRSGELPDWLIRKMPFTSLKEAFEIVLQKAKEGEPFCQYMIGNAYFWWDFLSIEGVSRASFASDAEFNAYMGENIRQCEDWFWKALRGGVFFAANNLNRFYREGDPPYVLPDPDKAKDLWKTGAELGQPIHQYNYADQLSKAGQKAEALRWYKAAAEGGQPGCWYYVGRCYETGEGTAKDLGYAVSCYEAGIKEGEVGCCNRLGALLYKGQGVRQDYARAVELLTVGYQHDTTWPLPYLGKCFYQGWGVPKDVAKAREFLEKVTWDDPEVYYLLGRIYARGEGVPEDIARGVAYLQKAGNYQLAKEELLRYKKTLFGGRWVRR